MKWITLGGLLVGVAANLQADPYVAIRAVADPVYAARRAAESPPREETYVFYQGQFFPGIVRDRTLEKTPFDKVVQTLAFDLQQQRYVPTRNMDEADLIIVVHWGVTTAFERSPTLPTANTGAQIDLGQAMATRDAMLEDPNAAAGFLNSELNAVTLEINALSAEVSRQGMDLSLQELGTDLRSTSAAALMGITQALRMENNGMIPTSRGAQLKAMLQEERYFIIAIAYDRRVLANEQRLHQLWSVRLSVRAAGVNFHTAISRLSTAGGTVFGQHFDDLAIKPVREHDGEIEFGELRVVGVVGEPTRNAE